MDEASVAEPEFNPGGGMAVGYSNPATVFDRATYGREIATATNPGETLPIEPGRAVGVYAEWYVTEVLDVMQAHGRWYAVLRGGTMHFRTPVPKQPTGHSSCCPAETTAARG